MRKLAVQLLTLSLVATLFAGCEPDVPKQRTNVAIGHAHTETEPLVTEWTSPVAEFKIDTIAWVNSVVEIHACESGEKPSLIKPAEAHVSTSSMRLGVPTVEELTKPQMGSRVVGELASPDTTYCRGYLTISPADEDVVNLTDVETRDVLDHSFLATGRYRPIAGAEWIAFEMKSTEIKTFEFPLFNPSEKSQPLILKPGDSAMLSIEKTTTTPADLIERPADLEDPDVVNQWIEAIGSSVKLGAFGG